MTIVLDTPEQINMWVLLSRRSQVQAHLKGYKVKGIIAALKRDIPGCENIRYVKDAVVPIEFAIANAGGNVDYRLVNVHVLKVESKGVFVDLGIYNDMSEVEANDKFVSLYARGRLEIVLTEDDVRPANHQ